MIGRKIQVHFTGSVWPIVGTVTSLNENGLYLDCSPIKGEFFIAWDQIERILFAR